MLRTVLEQVQGSGQVGGGQVGRGVAPVGEPVGQLRHDPHVATTPVILQAGHHGRYQGVDHRAGGSLAFQAGQQLPPVDVDRLAVLGQDSFQESFPRAEVVGDRRHVPLVSGGHDLPDPHLPDADVGE